MVGSAFPVVFLAILFATLLTASAAVLAYKVFSGELRTTGLLTDKQLGGLSQVRVQLLIITISSAAFYLIEAVKAAHLGNNSLPDIPQQWLVVAGLSNSIYVGGKSVSVARLLSNLQGQRSSNE
jgi:hypothetical protein